MRAAGGFGNDLIYQSRLLEIVRGKLQSFGRAVGELAVLPQNSSTAVR